MLAFAIVFILCCCADACCLVLVYVALRRRCVRFYCHCYDNGIMPGGGNAVDCSAAGICFALRDVSKAAVRKFADMGCVVHIDIVCIIAWDNSLLIPDGGVLASAVPL